MEDSWGWMDAARDLNGLSEDDDPRLELDDFRWCCRRKAIAAFGGEGVERLMCLLRFELLFEGETPPSPTLEPFGEFQLPKPPALDPKTCTLSGLFLLAFGEGPGDAKGVLSSSRGEKGDRSTPLSEPKSAAAKRLANDGELG